ncbi:hypothetical protein LTR99_009677 [Exophiala xenobiotica]|uniref:Fe2OG dioxygenase domain-containing protein n=1 Tax=Vermiconidia calcicola TaxID=1690605 RepID=A0AAV9PXB2_9PEZI|nr:hypothetical protein LTR72_007064 [Exophiala xenobiotica]KAK5530515.1 hypothetical protein LTR25_009093 [Vermiconidia calcicola]KAK5290715.1 hypothetical protein LTR14_006222 [Exophiala xenobiotica]KAK5294279.1 hypothetical protein LTR99_009677 [Exophiala xenobiotica]KAK5336172.1 hypothetical protein LTR98_007502 [Exophiala xenobiotica]
MAIQASLPVIDIAPYLDPNSAPTQRAATAHAVDHACREFGFFYLIGHGIPEELRQEMLRLGHEFFSLPQAEKDEISVFNSMDRVRGYARLGENVTSGKRDVLEGYDIYREYPNPSKDMLRGAQIWPSKPATLRSTVLEYVEKLIPVGQALMRAMGDGLGIQNGAEAFEEIVKDPFWGLKFNGYPPLSTPDIAEQEKGISCGEHTDYGGLTFLLADDHIKSALEVEDKSGDWIKADPIPGAYVVNIGDMVNVLTSNRYTATVHRVIHRGNIPRVSIPFFFEPSFATMVKPLQGCAEGNVLPKASVSYYEHMCHML